MKPNVTHVAFSNFQPTTGVLGIMSKRFQQTQGFLALELAAEGDDLCRRSRQLTIFKKRVQHNQESLSLNLL